MLEPFTHSVSTAPNPTRPLPSSAHLPHLHDPSPLRQQPRRRVVRRLPPLLSLPPLPLPLLPPLGLRRDFLLIEAAFHLPRWLNPDTSLHSLFLRNGTLRIVPKSLPNPSLLDSLSFISSSQSLAFDPIQCTIQNRIRDYPHRARRNMHRVRVRVPVSVTHLLEARAAAISLAVEAFYDRDVDTMKFAGAMERFLERGKARSWCAFR
ncbi:hypothetical protein Fmac_012978 [Flemingia macrophylla]|uniref:Uncharacterized protein n=1 Tax=Flemingia macrophylla TaxID=520843 RepID=A0ABD1MRU8_9FABA